MTRLVLDTNVLVSAVLSPYGAPAQLLDLVLDGGVLLVISPAILAEYRDVLRRPRFALDGSHIDTLMDTLSGIALAVAPRPWSKPLPDRDDEVFIASAAAGQALLVTGNGKDYPAALCGGVPVLSPRQALEQLRDAPHQIQEAPARGCA